MTSNFSTSRLFPKFQTVLVLCQSSWYSGKQTDKEPGVAKQATHEKVKRPNNSIQETKAGTGIQGRIKKDCLSM